jgi:hypothetical protein
MFMAISQQDLQNACRKVVSERVYGQDGWQSQLLDAITNLQAPALSKLPAAYQRAVYLNTLITVLEILGIGKKMEKGKLIKMPNPYTVTATAIKRCVQDYKGRWDRQVQDLENHLTFDYVDIKQNISKTISAAVAEMFNNNPDSFLNQVIVPSVIMAGAKRLPQIKDRDMAENYCTNLLSVSGLFNIYDSTEEGFDSVADTIESAFKTMALRLQDIYYALYPPPGLGGIVYSEPGVRKIRQCVEKYERLRCRGKANRKTVALKHIRINGADTLLLFAWYLEVNPEAGEGTVIRVIENPSHLSALLQTAVNNNMLWHLDELVDERRELIAWNQTLRLAA